MTITIADGRGALWQWDTGRRVKITDGGGVKQIHYQNRCFGRSVDVDVEDDGTAIIPDELLQDYHTLTAYAYVTDDAGGYTKVQQDFAVYKRAKPADYVYTPTERAGFDKLRAEIGELPALQTNAKNNLVAAINEAAASESMGITGATVGQIAKITAVDASGVPTAWEPVDMPSGGSPDAVLYTAQTLTDAQKKQARENIDALSDFVVNGTVESDMTVTLDKTFAQIQAAVQDGKQPVVKLSTPGPTALLPLTSINDEIAFFIAWAQHEDTTSIFYCATISSTGYTSFTMAQAVTINNAGVMEQVNMAFDPISPMQIATKKYVDDSIESGAGSSVQPDWNQNDDTQPDYVKNRPFYTGDPVETVLVEESTVTFADADDFYLGALESTFSAAVGETYKVSWDGTIYECACVEYSGITVFGNLSIVGVGSDTGEPFMMTVNNDSVLLIYTADTSASHTLSISGLASEVVKIDEKYLPDIIATKSEVEVAQNMANSNKEVLYSAFSSAVTFTFDKQTSGRDTFVFNACHYYKISDFNPAPENVISFNGTAENGDKQSKITTGNNCVEYGFFIVVASAGRCSLPVTDTDTFSFDATSAGLYAMYFEGDTSITAGTGQFTLMQMDGLTIKSSTANSNKKFRITVDDSGTLTATEVTK